MWACIRTACASVTLALCAVVWGLQVWKLSATDLSEIARNSVLQVRGYACVPALLARCFWSRCGLDRRHNWQRCTCEVFCGDCAGARRPWAACIAPPCTPVRRRVCTRAAAQSGFEHPFKVHFIGSRYAMPGPSGNDISLTNVPSP